MSFLTCVGLQQASVAIHGAWLRRHKRGSLLGNTRGTLPASVGSHPKAAILAGRSCCCWGEGDAPSQARLPPLGSRALEPTRPQDARRLLRLSQRRSTPKALASGLRELSAIVLVISSAGYEEIACGKVCASAEQIENS